MRWFIVILIFALDATAQPINGPYLITSVDEPAELFTSPLMLIDSVGLLHVFYVENDPLEVRIMGSTLHARTGEIVLEPDTVLRAPAEDILLEDVAMNENGRIVLLFIQSNGVHHHLKLFELNDDGAPPVVLLDTTDTMDPYWGGSDFEVLSPRFAALTSEYSQVVYWLRENTLTRIGDWWCGLTYDWPSVAFTTFSDSDTTITQHLPFEFGYEDFGSILAESLSLQSLRVWLGDYSSQKRYLVDALNGSAEESVINCRIANLAGQTFHNGTRVHLRGEHYYNSPTSQFGVSEILDSTCIQLTGYTCEGTTSRAVSNPDFGFAFSCNNGISIELVRLDSTGQLAASAGSIAWREEGWYFSHSTTAIGPDGLVASAWVESSSDLQRRRVAFASCEWATPLDVNEISTPVPQSISLSTYPNPFNSSVRIDYELPRASDARASIYNTLGEEVATLFDGHTNAGTHTLSWSPNSASGVYFVKLEAGDFVTSRKILYVR